MSRKPIFLSGSVAVAGTLLLVIAGCTSSKTEPSSTDQAASIEKSSPSTSHSTDAAESGADHAHEAGAHGGILVSLGRDSYHVEAIVTDGGELRLYTLGNDETRVMDVPIQDLVAYVKSTTGSESASVTLKPEPQPGDAEGNASLFVAQLPEALVGGAIKVTVPNITIKGERFRLGFTTETDDHGVDELSTGEHGDDAMPEKVADDAEKELYLTPAGLYTQADIEANGNVTASQKFKGFKAKHDLHPKPGDKICPVTLTLANPECTWIIGGKAYEFCCPPCVDEFVAMAKTSPEDVKDPSEYVQDDGAANH
jgi:hypothetical protein